MKWDIGYPVGPPLYYLFRISNMFYRSFMICWLNYIWGYGFVRGWVIHITYLNNVDMYSLYWNVVRLVNIRVKYVLVVYIKSQSLIPIICAKELKCLPQAEVKFENKWVSNIRYSRSAITPKYLFIHFPCAGFPKIPFFAFSKVMKMSSTDWGRAIFVWEWVLLILVWYQLLRFLEI